MGEVVGGEPHIQRLSWGVKGAAAVSVGKQECHDVLVYQRPGCMDRVIATDTPAGTAAAGGGGIVAGQGAAAGRGGDVVAAAGTCAVGAGNGEEDADDFFKSITKEELHVMMLIYLQQKEWFQQYQLQKQQQQQGARRVPPTQQQNHQQHIKQGQQRALPGARRTTLLPSHQQHVADDPCLSPTSPSKLFLPQVATASNHVEDDPIQMWLWQNQQQQMAAAAACRASSHQQVGCSTSNHVLTPITGSKRRAGAAADANGGASAGGGELAMPGAVRESSLLCNEKELPALLQDLSALTPDADDGGSEGVEEGSANAVCSSSPSATAKHGRVRMGEDAAATALRPDQKFRAAPVSAANLVRLKDLLQAARAACGKSGVQGVSAVEDGAEGCSEQKRRRKGRRRRSCSLLCEEELDVCEGYPLGSNWDGSCWDGLAVHGNVPTAPHPSHTAAAAASNNQPAGVGPVAAAAGSARQAGAGAHRRGGRGGSAKEDSGHCSDEEVADVCRRAAHAVMLPPGVCPQPTTQVWVCEPAAKAVQEFFNR
jgi:uncharacterized protein YcfJ